MSEWWTYRPADFLMFAPRTYYRLFEIYNTEVWPGPLVVLALGLALLGSAARRTPAAARVAMLLLGATWLWVAWAFHWQRYATIHTAAPWFAAAFAAQGVLLLACGGIGARWRVRTRRDWRGRVGLGLLLFAQLAQPWLGVALGRPWRQAELFGLAPDPTVLGTLGLILLLQPGREAGTARSTPQFGWLLWSIPLLWCAISGVTLWTMQAPDAALMPGAALLAVGAAWRATQAERGSG